MWWRQQEEPTNFLKTERLEFYTRNNQIPPDPAHEETTLVASLDDLLLDGFSLGFAESSTRIFVAKKCTELDTTPF